MFDRSKTSRAASAVLVAALVAAVAVSAALLLVAPARASTGGPALTPASGSTEQWAFGGSASAYYSCSEASCFNGTSPGYSFSLSIQYYIAWVAIYTQTNLSSTQTMYEAQAALNATLKETVSDNGTTINVDLSGRDTAAGFTNVSSVGSVNVTGGATLGPTTALAILNAASTEAFNFSGTASETNSTGTTSIGFDIGGNEASSVTFTGGLGLVPLSPVPGETWSSEAPFSATGSWTSGFSLSEVEDGQSYTYADWTPGTVSPSGTLWVNGTDLGAYTLWDNYTSPPTSVTAQLIYLDFSNGTFGAEDGWVLVPSGLFAFSGDIEEAAELGGGPAFSAALQPAQSDSSTIAENEDAYYQSGPGFVGVTSSASGSDVGQSGTPTISVSAGPEPTSVAEQQYSGITGKTSASSPSSIPWTFVIIGVVVAVVAIVGAMGAVARSRRRRPPAAVPPGYVPPMYAGAAGPTGPQGPTAPAQEAPAGYAATAAVAPAAITPPAGPVCPSCGQPGTYVAQYGRYYCYQDKAYL